MLQQHEPAHPPMIAAEVEAVLVLAAEAVVLEATDMKDGEAAGGASPAACHVRLAEAGKGIVTVGVVAQVIVTKLLLNSRPFGSTALPERAVGTSGAGKAKLSMPIWLILLTVSCHASGLRLHVALLWM